MVNLIDLFHQKIELFRLEQRYTRRRNRRSTFVSEAQYVDGEYIYSSSSPSSSSYQPSPKSPRTVTTTYEAKCSSGGSDSDEVASPVDSQRERESKSSKRLSRMGSVIGDWRKKGGENRVNVREVKWER